MKSRFSLCLIFFIIYSCFAPLEIHSAVEYQTHTDFITIADKAKWKSSYGDQIFPGKAGSRTGAAYWLKNITMENGNTYPLILQTTPDVKSNGYIMGTYPEMTIPEKARLNVEFGFPKNADKTKGVTFFISFNVSSVKSTTSTLVSKFKAYTQDTEKVVVNLANYVGKKGNFVVMVVGGKTPTLSDVASWNKILLEVEKPPRLYPDLVIKDIQVKEGKVSYTIQNIGNGATSLLRRGSSYNTQLMLDGKEVALDKLTSVLDPNESMVRTFPDYILPKSRVNQTLTVCADSNAILEESNERNNCQQKVIPPETEEEYPDLFIAKITLENNRISYVLQNNGPGSTANIRRGKVFQTSLRVNGVVVAVDTLLKGLNSQDQVTRTFTDFLMPSSKEEQTIVVCADADDAFQETNERNNCLQKIIPPVPAEDYPDLVILKVMVEKGKISYTIKNTGKDSTLTLFKGKTIQNQLLLDGIEVAVDNMTQGLVANQEITRTMPNFILSPSKNEQILRVCADFSDMIQETNERNNCLEKNVPPEPIEEEPLRFTKLPEVSAITSDSAKITWETNRESASEVHYDNRYSLFESKKTKIALSKIHSITLTNLKPGTLYHYYVMSIDAEGNKIQSEKDFFKTLTERLQQRLFLHFTLPPKLTGFVKIIPELSDIKHFSRLRLFIDGKLIFSNLSKPFDFEINTKKILNGIHEFKIEGTAINGEKIVAIEEGLVFNPDLTANLGPIIEIASPNPNQEYPNTTTHVPIKSRINHRSDFSIRSIAVFVDGNLVFSSHVRLGKRIKEWAIKDDLPKAFDYDIPIDRFDEGGTHEIEIRATDSALKTTSKTISVVTHTPYWKRPSVVCYFSTSIKAWTGNSYQVRFYIANNGNATAKNVVVEIKQDFLPGFIISNVNPPDSISFDWTNNQQILKINLDELDYHVNNKVYQLTFDLAPVLTYGSDWGDFIALNEVKVLYDWDENSGSPHMESFDISYDAATDTEWMAGHCDYLIVSNLAALKAINSDQSPTRYYSKRIVDPLKTLLMRMSELAVKKQGIVALLNTTGLSANSSRMFIHGIGEKIKPTWDDNGYLLLVGETEIIPTFSRTVGEYVFDSDAAFANTSGNENYPELTMGRIIGDSIYTLSKPIKASLDVSNGIAYFRRNEHPLSKAFIVSGVGDGESAFWNNAEDVGEILQDEMYTVSSARGQNIINAGHTIHETLQNACNGLSVLYYRDHGGTHCWCGGGVITASSESDKVEFADDFDFGDYRPFIFACCCQSGNFSGIYGIANLFMEKAGAYLSATEDSSRSANNTYSQFFFNSWVGHPDKSLATAFKETRIQSRDNTRWNLEYHFYGDAKFGVEAP